MSTSVYDARIQAAAKQHLMGWDWRLLKAQYIAESRLAPEAVSWVGARGIAQFMPTTWAEVVDELGYPADADPHNPDLAIPAGAHYLARMINGWTAPRPDMDRYCLALASYNAGFGNMLRAQKRAGGVNDYAGIMRALPAITGERNASQTAAYVKRILNYYNQLVTG